MNFTFEESELINSLYEDVNVCSKAVVINDLKELKLNSDEVAAQSLIDNVIDKIDVLSTSEFLRIFNNLPIVCLN